MKLRKSLYHRHRFPQDIKTLQKFTSVHVSVHHHFNHQRHLNRRDIFKPARAAALAEWGQVAA